MEMKLDRTYEHLFQSLGVAVVTSTLLVSIGKALTPYYFFIVVMSSICLLIGLEIFTRYKYKFEIAKAKMQKERQPKTLSRVGALRRASFKAVPLKKYLVKRHSSEKRVKKKQTILEKPTIFDKPTTTGEDVKVESSDAKKSGWRSSLRKTIGYSRRKRNLYKGPIIRTYSLGEEKIYSAKKRRAGGSCLSFVSE